MRGDGRTHTERRSEAAAALRMVLPDDPTDATAARSANDLRSHAEQCGALLSDGDGDDLLLAAAQLAYAAGDYSDSLRIAELFGGYESALIQGRSLRRLGRTSEAIDILEAGLALAARQPAEMLGHIADLRSAQALALIDMGRRPNLDRAVDLLTQVLATRRSVRPVDHAALGVTLGNLGLAQQALGMTEEALANHSRALAEKRMAPFPDQMELAVTHMNLALLQWQLGRRRNDPTLLGHAIDNANQALAIDRELYESDHPELAFDYLTLGVALTERARLLRHPHDFEAGWKALARAREIRTKRLGRKAGLAGVVVGWEAEWFFVSGELDKARETATEALRICTEAFGDDHRHVSRLSDLMERIDIAVDSLDGTNTS